MSTYIIQILAGLGRGSVLFLVASGLTLIFGALRIINFAHASLYMIGAFLSVTLVDAVGLTNWTFWLILFACGLAVMAIGTIMEIAVFRRIYDEPLLTQLLVTFAFVFIIGGSLRAIYGPGGRITDTPPFLEGSIRVAGKPFPQYQVFLIILALVVAGMLWATLYGTNLGRLVRAAVNDAELLAISGVNVRWLFTGVFALGCFFAGLAGAAVAPAGAVGLGMDIDVILKAFVVIVIGGLGSLRGALLGSMVVGVSESLGVLWIPEASLAIVFAVLVAVLAVRPQGIFGSVGA